MLRLAWKNITHRPLSLILNVLLLSLGVGLISFLVKVNDQLKDQFDKNLASIDLVIGAKGSPLQMILCSMYHIDNPTGNISIEEATPYLRPNHPLLKQAVPLSLGDSYQGYRIVGTEPLFIDLYDGELSEGQMFAHTNEVIVGVTAAKNAKLEIGSTFKSSHGFVQDDDMTHDHGTLKVVGLLKPSGSVLDQLILTPTSTVWAAHDHEEEHEHEEHDHGDHNHDGHDHAHEHHHHVHDVSREDLISHPDKEITSILVQYKSKTNIHALNLPRTINNNTDMMAASPPFEINRLYSMMGAGTKVLQGLAILIAIVSALSIFISLLNSLKERSYELSLIRVLGASPGKLFSLLILEGLLLAFIGAVVGLVLSRVALYFLSGYMGTTYRYDFAFGMFDHKDLVIFFISLAIGVLAALIPAIRAYRTDIHNTLGNN